MKTSIMVTAIIALEIVSRWHESIGRSAVFCKPKVYEAVGQALLGHNISSKAEHHILNGSVGSTPACYKAQALTRYSTKMA